jgi:hypothetical protein
MFKVYNLGELNQPKVSLFVCRCVIILLSMPRIVYTQISMTLTQLFLGEWNKNMVILYYYLFTF